MSGVRNNGLLTPDTVGRNVDEIVRVLYALQSDQLTPCGWHPGQQTLGAA